ncbi:ATP-dependent DNA helicase RecQ-like [Oculina patagonica]
MAECIPSKEKIAKAIEASLNSFPNINKLKPEQMLVVESIVRGVDVFGALPTGFGKSLTFHVLPSVLKYLQSSDAVSTASIVIVVCPLTSIIKDQVKYLRSLGFGATFLGESPESDKRICAGMDGTNFVYGTPESFLGDQKFREMFSNQFFRQNVAAIVCDEVHTIVQWGEKDNSNKEPFRKWCGAVGELRSLLPQGIPMLALTATASAATRKEIIRMLFK